jgi:hypothetical protein
MHNQVVTGSETISLFNTESATQPEVWEKKSMGPFYRVLFIVACHHIAITQMVYGHVLQTIK